MLSFLIVVVCIALLIFLISWIKVNTFVAFVVVSIFAGVLLGLPASQIPNAIQKGIDSGRVENFDPKKQLEALKSEKRIIQF